MSTPFAEIQVLSVSALTQSIKSALEGQFRFVAVQGEVSNAKLQSSGHFYFSIKDQEAQIGAVMFKADVQQLERIPKEGDQVILKGALNVYPPSGRYQIVARSLEFSGIGALLLKLEALKVKLKGLGYFRQERKKPLPKFPKTIGVITSPTGAVIQDILNVLSRRYGNFHLILYPVKVQGDGAKEEIAKAINFFNAHALADVLIVGRGGGSIEDLFAFNEEIVATAIFESRIPIISAVGHETDHCIADYVADVRAPTPSAAAEIVMAEKALLLKSLEDIRRQLLTSLLHFLRKEREKLQGILRHPLFTSPHAFLTPLYLKTDDFREKLNALIEGKLERLSLKVNSLQKQVELLKPSVRVQNMREKIRYLQRALDQKIKSCQEVEGKKIERIVHLLQALDPRNLLTKGYSIIFSEKSGSIITSVCSLSEGEKIRLLFADGQAQSTIDSIKSQP